MVCSGGGENERGSSEGWDFDGVTMVRPSKSREQENHTPNIIYENGRPALLPVAGNASKPEAMGVVTSKQQGDKERGAEAVTSSVEGEEEEEEAVPPQLGIDDTAFVSHDLSSPNQRNSVVSLTGRGTEAGGGGGKRGSVVSASESGGVMVVSIAWGMGNLAWGSCLQTCSFRGASSSANQRHSQRVSQELSSHYWSRYVCNVVCVCVCD